MKESPLILRISSIRTRARRRLLVFGILVVAAGGVASFLTIAVMDWLLWLPSMLRVFVAGAYLVGLVGASYHWIARPLGARLGHDEVAGRLEARFPELRDRLTSTVDFLRSGEEEPPVANRCHGEPPVADRCHTGSGSEAMIREVVANTEKITADMPLESALILRPLFMRAGLLAASVFALAVIGTGSPDWVRVGFYRYIYPWGEIEWPKSVSIRPLTGDQVVAIGDSATVRMEIQRGLHEHLRGVVRIVEAGDVETTLTMQPGADNTFSATIDRVTEDLTYWFEAGDDSTEQTKWTIRAVRRPEVIDALAEVEPPPYAPDHPTVTHDFSDGPVRAPIGGHVRVSMRSSKPLTPRDSSCLALLDENGLRFPLQVDSEDPRGISSLISVRSDLRLRAVLCDEYGFENRGTDRYTILAVEDRVPVVTFLKPAPIIEITPNGTIDVTIQVMDDFGVTKLELDVQRAGREASTIELTNQLLATEREGEARREHVVTAAYEWSMESETVSPGDLLTYVAIATDNYDEPVEGRLGRSNSMSIRVISEAEFETRLRSDLALLETRIRESMLDEAELLDRTEALRDAGDGSPVMQRSRGEVAGALAIRQTRLVRRMRELSNRFQELIDRMRLNRAGDLSWRREIASLSEALLRTSAGPMTTAVHALDELREAVETKERLIERAVRGESEAVESLRSMLRSISQWGDQKELMAKSRNLLNRQEALRAKTTDLGKSMLGLEVDSLTPAQKRNLNRVARQQQDLGADVEQLLTDLQSMTDRKGKGNAQGAERADEALRAARARDLSNQLAQAADRIGENRTAAANIAQKAASDGIRKMIEALADVETRQLEELRKRITRALDQVIELLEQQESLRSATEEAGLLGSEQDAVDALAGQQRALRRNTNQLGKELTTVERTMSAGRLVRRAAGPMTRVEQYLRDSEVVAATTDQDEALLLLREAVEKLEELANRTDNEVLRRSLEQIRDSLEEVLHAQQEVNAGIEELDESMGNGGDTRDDQRPLGRREARVASRLAREQAAVRSLVESQKNDFERVVVYRWALERVAGWMETSQSRLQQRQVDDELSDVTNRIVNELKKLIQAIVDTVELPLDTQFVESESGGGGGGPSQAMAGKPVPTVAELLVLKAMQADIIERTRSLDDSIDLQNAGESELRQLQTLGEDQAEVRRLSELVTRKARNTP